MKKLIRLENGNVKVQTINDLPSKTQQQFAEQTNINNIMKKYHATGMITHLNQKQGQYVDLSTIKDYQSSLQTVIDANASFMTLSSEIRKKFNNNPQELLSFLADPKNKDEAISLKIINPPKAEPQPNPIPTPQS
jgi:phage internal scaffolding protein